MTTTTIAAPRAAESEAAMSDFTTTVTPVEPAPFGGGTYRIDCSCGERVTYAGEAFTAVEANRHRRWHASQVTA